MYFVLPRGREGLTRIERRLSADELEFWFAKVEPMRARVKLPRFRVAPRTVEANVRVRSSLWVV